VTDTNHLVTIVIDLYRSVHQQMREELTDLEDEALHWTPGPQTNSICTLVVHLLGSEAEMLRSALGLPHNRQRDAEFATQDLSCEDLLRLLDTADSDLESLGSRLTEQDLQTLRMRPGKPSPQPGWFWLVRNYGHVREHLAHLQLTKQLYLARVSRA
jgi:uncharacterized damage-inducible protein DinB